MASMELINWEIAAGPDPIPGTNWMNPTGSKQAAIEYWRQQNGVGEPADIARIVELSDCQEYHLEAVGLLNGLRYALVKDAEGNDAFDNRIFSSMVRGDFSTTSPANIRNVSLGSGYVLKAIFAAQARDSKGAEVMSCVEKIASDAEDGAHKLQYHIEPYNKHFSGSYVFSDADTGETLYFDDKETTILLIVGDQRTRDQAEFGFDRQGAIKSIAAVGRYLLHMPGAQVEVLPLTQESTKGILSLEGPKIDSSFARSIFTDTFGSVPIEGIPLSELRIDVPEVVSSLIKNMNGDLSAKPHDFVKEALV
jgi:hypothetical protein